MNPSGEQGNVQEICDELSQFSLVDAPTLEGDGDVSIGSFTLVPSEEDEGYELVPEYAPTPAMQFLSATGLEPSEEGERLAGRYLETAEGDVDLAVGLYFDSDPQSLVAPNEADADDTTKKPPATDEDMDKKPAAADTKVDCDQKADSEGWPSVVYLDEFVRATGLEESEGSRRLARAYLTATDCNVDLAVHLYLEEAQSLDGSVSALEAETGDAVAESMEHFAGEDVALTAKCKLAKPGQWREAKTGLECSAEDGLSAKQPSSQSNSAFNEFERIRALQKPIDREEEFEKEFEGLKIGSPDDTREKIKGMLSKHLARVRNARTPNYDSPPMSPSASGWRLAEEVLPTTVCNKYGCCLIPGEYCKFNESCVLRRPDFRRMGPSELEDGVRLTHQSEAIRMKKLKKMERKRKRELKQRMKLEKMERKLEKMERKRKREIKRQMKHRAELSVPVLERLRLSVDIDDMYKFKKRRQKKNGIKSNNHRQKNSPIPVPSPKTDANSSDG